MLEGSLNRGPPRAGLQGCTRVSLTPQTSASSSPSGHHQMSLDAGALPPAPLESAPQPLSSLSPWWGPRGRAAWQGGHRCPGQSTAWPGVLPAPSSPRKLPGSLRIRSALAGLSLCPSPGPGPDSEEGGKVSRVKRGQRTTDQGPVHSQAWRAGSSGPRGLCGQPVWEAVCFRRLCVGLEWWPGMGVRRQWADPGTGRTVFTPKLPAGYLKPPF